MLYTTPVVYLSAASHKWIKLGCFLKFIRLKTTQIKDLWSFGVALLASVDTWLSDDPNRFFYLSGFHGVNRFPCPIVNPCPRSSYISTWVRLSLRIDSGHTYPVFILFLPFVFEVSSVFKANCQAGFNVSFDILFIFIELITFLFKPKFRFYFKQRKSRELESISAWIWFRKILIFCNSNSTQQGEKFTRE